MKMLQIGICFLLFGCPEERRSTKVDICRQIQFYAKNLLLAASEYRDNNNRWPKSFKELEATIVAGDSTPESFLGGSENWEFELDQDDVLYVTYIGYDGRKCNVRTFTSKWLMTLSNSDNHSQ